MKDARLVLRNLRRRPGRSLLTLAGTAAAVLVILLVEALGAGADAALADATAARTLLVYRAHRYCPQTSSLPQRYGDVLARVPGVESVLPVKVFLNNCRTSLDVVAFHGVPAAAALEQRALRVVAGEAARFVSEPDAALVGRDVAARKGLSVGDRFRFGGLDVKVVGVFEDDSPVREGLILTHLDFLQRSAPVDRPGEVTQFELRLRPEADPLAVAAAIDAAFAADEAPTSTWPMARHVARATRDLRELLRFARGLGLACALLVLVLVANAVLLSAHERRHETALLRVLGFGPVRIAGQQLAEALALTLAGGALGAGLALALVHGAHPGLGAEGVPVPLRVGAGLLAGTGLLLAALGVLAGLLPALAAACRPWPPASGRA